MTIRITAGDRTRSVPWNFPLHTLRSGYLLHTGAHTVRVGDLIAICGDDQTPNTSIQDYWLRGGVSELVPVSRVES